MIRKIKVTDYPRLMEIWESAVLSTHDFLKEEDFIYYKGQLPVYFQYVNLFGFEHIFPINDDGYSYFGLLSLDGFFQLCLQLSLLGKQEGGD